MGFLKMHGGVKKEVEIESDDLRRAMEKFRKMISEFYEYKGLDENGEYKPETLERMGLDKEPSHLL